MKSSAAKLGKLALIIIGLLLVSCSGGGGSSDSSGQSSEDSALLVGAHYYFWFPENFGLGYLRQKLVPQQGPIFGEYSSSETAVAEAQIGYAADAGIDFLTLDYWPALPQQNSRIDSSFLRASNLSRIRFAVFYETWNLNFSANYGATDFDDETTDRFVADIKNIAVKYFYHPQYLRVNGRPVLFLYLTRTAVGGFDAAMARLRSELSDLNPLIIGDEIFWKVTVDSAEAGHPILTTAPQPKRISLFDAVFSYNLYESEKPEHSGYGANSSFVADSNALYEQYRQAVNGAVPVIPTVIPGYNDRGVRPSLNHYAIPRQWSEGAAEGSLFAELFDRLAVPNIDSRLPMVLITSWNEWNEDTAIEPAAPAPPTAVDNSSSKTRFTQGYEYSGFDTTYLDIIAAKKAAAASVLRLRR